MKQGHSNYSTEWTEADFQYFIFILVEQPGKRQLLAEWTLFVLFKRTDLDTVQGTVNY